MTLHSNPASPLFLFILGTKLQGRGQRSIPVGETLQLLHLLIRDKEPTDRTKKKNRRVNMAHTLRHMHSCQWWAENHICMSWPLALSWEAEQTRGGNCEQPDKPCAFVHPDTYAILPPRYVLEVKGIRTAIDTQWLQLFLNNNKGQRKWSSHLNIAFPEPTQNKSMPDAK